MPRQNDHRITIRLKPEEYAEVVAKAGSRPLAQFFRESVLATASRKRATANRRPIKDHAAWAQLLALLGPSKLVVTFKEVANAVDDGTAPRGEDTDALLKQIATDLAEIKSLAMSAQGVSEQ